MGVVTASASTSASRASLRVSARVSNQSSASRGPVFLAFKTDKIKRRALCVPREARTPVKTIKEHKEPRRAPKPPKRVTAVSVDEVSLCTSEVDYSEAAAKLENIFKRSPAVDVSDLEDEDHTSTKIRERRKRTNGNRSNTSNLGHEAVVRSRTRRNKRMSLEQRIFMSKNKEDRQALSIFNDREDVRNESGKLERLVRDYSASTDLVSLDWKKMQIPRVLPSTEHSWLFTLMQPRKALLQLKEDLQSELEREPAEIELAEAANMTVAQLSRNLEVGHAARNKLIMHNLRLVLYVINKYFQEFANGPRFQDLCQAGVQGLITAIDRFEPRKSFRLSTYGLFWIRHAITRSLTVSSFTRVPFGLESVRGEIQKAKLELMVQLQRLPTEEEIIRKVGISPERYHEVMKASKPVLSLHSNHLTTQEELINGIADEETVGGDKWRQPTLLRLALDDVLDSLKPKESLVIRQRYGLDGKGDRTLGEIAGNLNISREMVRKHEVKALMKLKHPTRVDYLRRYVF